MSGKLKTVHITLTPQIAELLGGRGGRAQVCQSLGSRSQRRLEGLCQVARATVARRIKMTLTYDENTYTNHTDVGVLLQCCFSRHQLSDIRS